MPYVRMIEEAYPDEGKSGRQRDEGWRLLRHNPEAPVEECLNKLRIEKELIRPFGFPVP